MADYEVVVGENTISYDDVEKRLRRITEQGMATARFREVQLKRMTLTSGDVGYLKALSRDIGVAWNPADPGAKDLADTLAKVVGVAPVDQDAVIMGSLLLGKPMVLRGVER
jgi:hypothetical protein